jgi:hypothetical protein
MRRLLSQWLRAVQPAQRGLYCGVLRWRERLVGALNEFVWRKAVGILLPAPVSLCADGEPQGSSVGKSEHFVDGRNSLGMLSEKSGPRTAAKRDSQRLTGAAGAPIDQHRNIRNGRHLVGRARDRRVRIDLSIFRFAGYAIPVCRHRVPIRVERLAEVVAFAEQRTGSGEHRPHVPTDVAANIYYPTERVRLVQVGDDLLYRTRRTGRRLRESIWAQ